MGKSLNKEIVERYLKDNTPSVLEDLEIIEYINNSKIIVKDEFGKLKTNYARLKKGFKPSVHSAINKSEYCINQFKKIHGDTYDYSKVDYKKDNIKVTLICTEHGEFEQKPNVHKNGSGCPLCSFKTHKGLYNIKNLHKNKDWNNKIVNLYLFNIFNKNENFYKVGISKDVKRRARQIIRSSKRNYNIRIHHQVKFTLKEAIEFENELLNNKECFTPYEPNHHFQGHTECYKTLQ